MTSASTISRYGGGSFVLVLSAFGLFGIVFGVWLVLLADLQRALQLSPGALGGALTAGLAASLPAMLLGGRIADRWGAPSLMAGAAALIALALLGVALVGSYWPLVGLLFLFFGATGAYDVGINAAAMTVEQETGRRVIPYFHAAFSGFAALGALFTGVLVFFGMPFRQLYLILSLLVVAFAALAWLGKGLSKQERKAPGERQGWGLYRAPAILLLAGITGLAFLAEGELGNWSAIYLRSTLEFPAVLGAAGIAIFHGAMLIGRLGTAHVASRLGRRRTLQAAGAAVAAGMLLSLASALPSLILCGFLIVGLALAGIAPLAFSLAGDLAAERAGEASSVIVTVGYSGFLLGPALVGGVAELVGLRLALLSVVVAGGLIALLGSRVLEQPGGAL